MSTMNFFTKLRILAVATLALGAFGCSSSGGSGGCQSAGRALCQAACDCTDGPACALATADADGGSGGTITFDSQADCNALIATLGCSGGDDPGIDYAACDTAIAAGMCVMDGAGDSAFVSPPACSDP